MHRSFSMTCIGLLFLMAGCIPSLHPLYTEQDLIFDPALVGQWAEKDSKESWTFTKSGEKEYKLLYVDGDGKKGEFVVHLLTFNEQRFLDLFPEDPGLEQNSFYKLHLLPVHTFLRLKEIEPALQMDVLKPDWLEKILAADAGALRHEKMDGSILLTAQPKELQAFLLKHAQTAEAWSECGPLTRQGQAEKAKE